MILTNESIDPLITGLAILGCGGGGTPKTAKRLLSKALQEGFTIKRVDELKNQIGPSVYLLGSAGLPTKEEENSLLEGAFLALQEFIGKRFNAIMPAEIGPDIANLIAVAQKLGVQLIDGDLTGGRAAPMLYHNAYFINGIATTPMAIRSKSTKRIIADATDDEVAESTLRKIASDLNELIGVADHAMPLSEYSDILPSGTISFALRLGKDFRDSYPSAGFGLLESRYHGRIVFKGRVTSAELNSGGFLSGTITLNNDTDELSIAVLNEFVCASRNGKVVSKFPDLICLFGRGGKPLMADEVKKGEHITVVELPRNVIWTTKRAHEIAERFLAKVNAV